MTGAERDDLVAAAASGALTEEEAARLDALRRRDPSVDAEVAALRRTLVDLRDLGGWREEAPGDLLRARVARIGGTARRSRRTGIAVAAAAACLVVGAIGGAALVPALAGPHQGRPGQLGALEHVDFDDRAGVRVDGDVVAHTWGTETVLRASGLRDAATYSVVLVRSDGRPASSGSFRGTRGTVTCAVNGALLREEVAEVRVVDGDRVVATASLPPVP